MLFVFVGQYPVADEEPYHVWELCCETFGGFDYVIVAFKVKQACYGNEDNRIFGYVVFATEVGPLLLRDGFEEIIFFDGRIGGREFFGRADTCGEGLIGHSIGDADKSVGASACGLFDSDIELIEQWILVGMKSEAMDCMNYFRHP